MVKELISTFILYPVLGGLFLVAVIVCSIIFRRQLRAFVEKRFKLKISWKTPSIKDFCDDIKHVFVFKSHIVMDNAKTLSKCLMRHVDRERKTGEVLVFDLSQVKQINDNGEEALRDVIRDIVTNNCVRCHLVFPKKVLNKLYKETIEHIEEKSCNSVTVSKNEGKMTIEVPRFQFKE